ncbi:MAG: 4Fe-4S dicluster domain-containing protein [Lentisphaerae bacterium]|nr:4Fe-4S dicluster domain-containing protein [Lentisphaerota bacterium]
MIRRAAAILAFLVATAIPSAAVERFPKPEFETGYTMPGTLTPPPRADILENLDVAVLAGAIALASWIVLKRRSRRETFWLMLFCLLYFGFWRKGCVCPVGSVQNVSLALADRSYVIPYAVVASFFLPLLAALFFGRTFCAAVCPLGAIQDIVLLRPLKVPSGIACILGMIPVVYLAASVVMAVTGSRFIICRYDPFVGFFRLGGPAYMMAAGALLLLLGTVIGRPYCRFICPYSVLLGWASKIARRHVTITPDECVQCRLCEESCPFGAILMPLPKKAPEPRVSGRRRLVLLFALLPVVAAASGWIGARVSAAWSRSHATVATAEAVLLEDRAGLEGVTIETETYRKSGLTRAALMQAADLVRDRYVVWGALAGVFVGLAFWARLYEFSVRRRRDDYVPDRETCVSCARCFEYCPKERQKDTGAEAGS